ncbi:MAG: MFS transporter [Nanoarchaeota archaeon]
MIPLAAGRIAQGLAGVGSKFAPAVGGAKAAAPAIGGAIQGLGMGAGIAVGQLVAQPVKGFVGWFVNFWPDNIYGWFLWMGAFIYWLDWQTGFNAAATANFHLSFAIVAFLLIGFTQRFLNSTALLSTTGIFLSLIGFINATDIRGRGFAAVAFMIAFYFYSRTSAPGFFKLLPIVAFVDVYGMPVFRDVVLGYAANINYVSFVTAFVFNRILFPIWLWFGAIALYENTRVARKVLTLIIIFYFVVTLPTITAAYKSKVAGLTTEEKEVSQGIWERFQINARRVVSGEFLKAPVASAYEKAGQLYGFGQAKEEPKIGLQLVNDPNMPQEFNLEFYDAAAPSVIMEVPNPLPLDDPKKRVINVVEVECEDKTTGDSNWKLVEPSPKPDPDNQDTYATVYYKGRKPVTCKFENFKEGSYTVEIKATYAFHANADFSTAFMSRDRLEAKVFKGEDPAVKDKVPFSTAGYDNGPIAITWGGVELVSPPVGVKAGSPLGFLLFVAKTGAWEGEIAGIKSLTLITPSEFEFVETGDKDKTCSFTKVKEESNAEVNVYKVKEELIKKEYTIKEKDGKERIKVKPRFIGDGIRFMCPMSVSSGLLDELAGPGDTDRNRPWKGGTFKVSVDYLFSTKKTVSFKVKGCEARVTKGCTTKDDNKCPGTQTCNADRTWGEVCNDIPNDDCPKGGAQP